MSNGSAAYRFIRYLESRLQGSAAGKAGVAGYRLMRHLRVGSRRRQLTRDYGRAALPTICCGELLGPGRCTLSHYTFAPWSTSPLEHAMIQGLARRLTPCHFLEIGSLRGELLANLNGFVASSISLSLSKDDMIKRGYPKAVVDTNLLYEKEVEKLTVIYADSREYDFSKMPLPPRNLVFVDGDHAYEMVRNDTRNVLSVCASESVIVWHDYALGDYITVNWPVFAGILDGLPRGVWNRLYHVNNTACAVLLPENWSVRPHQNPFYPETIFAVSISADQPASVGNSTAPAGVGQS